MKHLLKLADLDKGDILDILNLADQLKYENQHGIEHHHLKGKTLGMIFQKSSTRTRVSFATGMYQLGGQAQILSNRDLQNGRGEPVQDTARVLSRYLDGIMIRTFAQEEVETLAKYATIPVINGLTDFCHPCQVLADLMTIREHKGKLEGLKLCYVGDGNNMANSLIVGGLKVGMSVSVACHQGYRPPQEILEFAAGYGDKFELTDSPMQAAKDADVVITGRAAASALFLAPLKYEFGWAADDWDNLARGIMAGHLLECAGQVTGGYFADPGYKDVPELWKLGFPLIEIDETGAFTVTKVEGSGGLVSVDS